MCFSDHSTIALRALQATRQVCHAAKLRYNGKRATESEIQVEAKVCVSVYLLSAILRRASA